MEFTVRPARPEDAEGLHAIRTMPGVFEQLLAIPAERLDAQRRYLTEMGPNSHSFTAVTTGADGQELVIGNAGLDVMALPRMRHCADFGIMVHRDYQNQGVGRALLAALIDLADNWLGLQRIELTVYTDNQRAIHLYESFGFQPEGTKRMAALRRGEYADLLLMARLRPHAAAYSKEK